MTIQMETGDTVAHLNGVLTRTKNQRRQGGIQSRSRGIQSPISLEESRIGGGKGAAEYGELLPDE
jgi:hypothetical protein